MPYIYTYLGKKLHRVLLPLLRFSKEKRVRIIILSGDHHILLVRNWFGYQNWSLPGGGVKKNETPENAILRELYEETGVNVEPSHVSYVRSCNCHESSAPFEVDVYYADIKRRPSIPEMKSFEIVEREWHPIAALPDDLAMPIQRILKEIRDEY